MLHCTRIVLVRYLYYTGSCSVTVLFLDLCFTGAMLVPFWHSNCSVLSFWYAHSAELLGYRFCYVGWVDRQLVPGARPLPRSTGREEEAV